MLRQAVAGAAVLLALAGCTGSDGPAGAAPAPVPTRTMQFTGSGPDGTPATAAQLEQAAKIMRLRVDGLKISPVTVAVQGNRLAVTVPAAFADQVAEVSRVGMLRLRPKLAGPFPIGTRAYPGLGPAQSAELAKLDCATGARSGDDPAAPVVACLEDDKYLLGPAIVDGSDITEATASTDPNLGGWVVTITISGAGGAAWTDYTTRHNTSVTPDDPANQVAFVLDGQALSVPEIQSRIAGPVQITGAFTRQQAEGLASSIRSGALPVTLQRA